MTLTLIAFVLLSCVFVTWMFNFVIKDIAVTVFLLIGMSSFIFMFAYAAGNPQYILAAYGAIDLVGVIYATLTILADSGVFKRAKV